MLLVRSSLGRDVATVGIATLLSRVLGFIRDLGIATVLGAGTLSDAFFAAMLIPNLFRRLLADGALNASFVPAWIRVRTEGGVAGAQRFGEEALGAMLAVLGSLTLIGTLLAPTLISLTAPGFTVGEPRFALAVGCLRIAFPYVAIAGVVAVVAAALNAEGRVRAASFGLIIYNGVAVAAVALIAFMHVSLKAGFILSGAVVLAGLAQLAITGAAVLRLPAPPLRPRLVLSPDTRRFFAMALPGIIAAGIPQLTLMAGTMIASSSHSAVSWLYYAYRLYELPLGVISVAIASVMAPRIAASVRAHEAQTRSASSRAFEIAIGLALPAALGIAVLAESIAGGLFEHGAFGPRDTAAVAAATVAIAAGLPGHALEKVLGSISFAHQDTRTPMAAALAGLTAAVVVARALFPAYGHVGIAAAIAASGWIGAALLGLVMARRRWLRVENALLSRLPRIILIAFLMGLVIFCARALLIWTQGAATSALGRISELGALVILGVSVYGVGLEAVGITRFRDVVAALRASQGA
jgi:putative peptidoglycan lipid II flippase